MSQAIWILEQQHKQGREIFITRSEEDAKKLALYAIIDDIDNIFDETYETDEHLGDRLKLVKLVLAEKYDEAWDLVKGRFKKDATDDFFEFNDRTIIEPNEVSQLLREIAQDALDSAPIEED